MKQFIRKSLKKIYRFIPLEENHKIKLKSLCKRKFAFLVDDISYNEWKGMGKSEVYIKKDQDQYLKDLFKRSIEVSELYVQKATDKLVLDDTDPKIIAFYLPQFHPFKENNEWWGNGFTEWTNVSKAVPQFKGHYQPHLPDELGFYDLRLIEIQKQQIELAKLYGVHGFCYYYYWFSGKLLMERPLQQVLDNKELDMPFCICWANENWSRRWDGMEDDILIKQGYAKEDDLDFIKSVEEILRDERYIKIGGKPVLMVYRIGLLPNPKRTMQCWRAFCREKGIGEINLVVVQGLDFIEPEKCGCDCSVEFPPHTVSCPNITHNVETQNPEYNGIVYDLENFIKSKIYLKKSKIKLFKTVMPSWDNTARKPNNGVVFWNSSPAFYKEWLKDVILYTKNEHKSNEQFVFINAWNEWAEGAHLEPDRKYGYAYLQATKDAIMESRGVVSKKIVCVGHDAWKNGAQILFMNILKVLKINFKYEIVVLLKSGGPLEEEYKQYATVYNLQQGYPTSEALEGLLEKLYEDEYRIAITNTVITGDVVEYLKKTGFKNISLLHELPGVIRQYNAQNYANVIVEYSDKAVFPSNYVKDLFEQEISALSDNKGVIRPQGLYYTKILDVDKQESYKALREYLAIQPTDKIILGVGFADRRKGIDLFLDVADKVTNERKDIYFVWMGSIESDMQLVIDKKMKSIADKQQILFLEFQNDLRMFYAGADLYLMTSREDPFPSVVLESMAAKTPVIGFEDSGGFADIVTGSTGVLVKKCDVIAMSDKVLELIDDVNRLELLGDASKQLILDSYKFNDYIYDLLALLGHKYEKVSVVVPNYNYDKYLNGRLKNIIGQTYPVYEVVILDDNSKDGSRKIIEHWEEQYSGFIKSYFNKQNSGCVFKQWALGLEKASGKFVWIAEVDDLAECDFLEELIQPFVDSKVVLSYCQSKQVDSEHNVLVENYLEYTNSISESKWNNSYVVDGKVEIATAMAVLNTIPNVSGVVFKKHDINEILSELEGYRNAGDWYFYIWLMGKGSVAYNCKSLNNHCRHENSVTLNEKNKGNLYKEIVQMQDWIQEKFEISESTNKKAYKYRKSVRIYLGLDGEGN